MTYSKVGSGSFLRGNDNAVWLLTDSFAHTTQGRIEHWLLNPRVLSQRFLV